MRQLLISLGEFVLNVIVSGIVATILQQALSLKTFEQIMLGVVLFVSLLAIQMNYKISQTVEISERISAHYGVWSEVRDHVRRLAGIRDNLEILSAKIREISDGLKMVASRYSGEDDLFEPWYNDKLDELRTHLRHTVETESFWFDTSLLQEQDRIFKVFQGRETDYFWATSTCSGILWYTTPTGGIWIRGLDLRFKGGKIKSLKRLFVFDEESELKEFKTSLCFLLHQQSGYEFKVISREDFESVFRNFGDRTLVADFGIYGNHFVWETPPEDRIVTQYGEFCVSKSRIMRYVQLFDNLWLQGFVHNAKPVFDSLIGNRQ